MYQLTVYASYHCTQSFTKDVLDMEPKIMLCPSVFLYYFTQLLKDRLTFYLVRFYYCTSLTKTKNKKESTKTKQTNQNHPKRCRSYGVWEESGSWGIWISNDDPREDPRAFSASMEISPYYFRVWTRTILSSGWWFSSISHLWDSGFLSRNSVLHNQQREVRFKETNWESHGSK